MQELIKKIPEEIIRENIIPYTYQKQPEILCEDIKSFFKYKALLLKLYIDNCIDKDEYREWLGNDISRYMNNDVAIMLGYLDQNIYRYSLLFKNRNKVREEIIKYMHYIEREIPVERSINIQLCILNQYEREELKKFIYKNIYPWLDEKKPLVD